jgi:hypothetical protein
MDNRKTFVIGISIIFGLSLDLVSSLCWHTSCYQTALRVIADPEHSDGSGSQIGAASGRDGQSDLSG